MECTLDYAAAQDQRDPLSAWRNQFHFPRAANGGKALYFCGNSLGLQPQRAAALVHAEMERWATQGVKGHFGDRFAWFRYEELLTKASAGLVGALPEETVVMNSLSVNLHLLMVSFYCPTPQRFKILTEPGPFPSDLHIVRSQIRFHGFDPDAGMDCFAMQPGEVLDNDKVLQYIEAHGQSIALVLIGGVNYHTGQAFDLPAITKAAQAQGCVVGFDLAHAAGNLELQLHDWGVDFAAWCGYKYLNGGPGALSGVFVHARHARCATALPRFSGWWSFPPTQRFATTPGASLAVGAAGWQLSNPPLLSMTPLRASLEIFSQVGMPVLVRKSRLLTGYLEALLKARLPQVQILTPAQPQSRGCQLSLRLPTSGKAIYEMLQQRDVICDWREPNVLRVAPVPLYNSFQDVWRFVDALVTTSSLLKVD